MLNKYECVERKNYKHEVIKYKKLWTKLMLNIVKFWETSAVLMALNSSTQRDSFTKGRTYR